MRDVLGRQVSGSDRIPREQRTRQPEKRNVMFE